MAVDLGPALERWLACATAVLEPVGRAFVQPGFEVAWDDCCDGQVWVRLVAVSPTPGLTVQKASGSPCGPEWLDVTAAVGVVRCVHVVDDDGHAPTPAALTADALRMTADQAALLDAVACCIQPRQIVRWDPLGPSGGCAGGEWVFVARWPGCDCEGGV